MLQWLHGKQQQHYVPGHDVDEKVKLVVLGDRHGDIVPLQGPPLVVL